MARRVLITGLGTINAQGNNTDEFWAALCSGRGGIVPLEQVSAGTRISIGARVPHFDPHQHFSSDELPLLDRFSQFAIVAAREAAADAGFKTGDAALSRACAVIGSGCGGKHTDEETYAALYREGRSRVHPLTIPKGMPSAAASLVSKDLKIGGPVFSAVSACASGAHAIIQGHIMIKAGLTDIAFVGATDAPFTPGLLKAWDALRVVSNDTCRPFCRNRSGIVLGEGAGVLVLESEQHAAQRNARTYAELLGCGMSSDAGHVTRPDTNGIARAIECALDDAGIDASEVSYVNAHGTGTIANDLAETLALHRVFGSHAKKLAISATKSMHGHALGASSALEAIVTTLAIHHGVVPPTANFTQPGDGCDLDYVPNNARQTRIDIAISNAFAFGGLNAVLALKTTTPY